MTDLEKQIDLKSRQNAASLEIDAVLTKYNFGFKLGLKYTQEAIVPSLTYVDIKDYGESKTPTKTKATKGKAKKS